MYLLKFTQNICADMQVAWCISF